MLPWISLAAIVGARMLWQRRPGMVTAALFWAVALATVVIGWTANASQYLFTLGLLSNAAVTLANGGFMPVAMHRRGGTSARSVWVERADTQRLLFLADNFGTSFIRFSIGDVLLAAGFVASILGY